MRVTVAIDNDIRDKARSVTTKMHAPLRRVVNDALRAGLSVIEVPGKCRPYRTQPHDMGLKPRINLDNIQELLAQIDGENSR
jgi:hypothetical protein